MLAVQGNGREAIAQFRVAVEAAPDWPELMSDLAWILAAHPDASLRAPQEAVQLAQRAVRPAHDPRILDVLSVAWAAVGRFDEAANVARSARSAAPQRRGRFTRLRHPRTNQVVNLDVCFSTHHLQFAEDKDHTLYFSGDSNAIGWINTRIWDETKDIQNAQGWCPMIVDTNGDGKIGEYTNPGAPLDPQKDLRISGFPYGIVVNPKDGSVWWATSAASLGARGGVPGRIARMEIGSNPPYSCKTEIYEPPFFPTNPKDFGGYTPRGLDVDRNGILWTGLSGGPHMGSFDRSKCKTLNGPTAIGRQCDEGWTHPLAR